MNRKRFIKLLKYTKIPIICIECYETITIREYESHLYQHHGMFINNHCMFCHMPVHNWLHLYNCWRLHIKLNQRNHVTKKLYRPRTLYRKSSIF